jgi:AICAR transformylase/IMP cyclohydrolase PurH
MASDAFFLSRLCSNCKEAGITAVIQPGGSIKPINRLLQE